MPNSSQIICHKQFRGATFLYYFFRLEEFSLTPLPTPLWRGSIMFGSATGCE
jgi:hypothetical protein